MPLSGGPAKPLANGFVAPTVGLGGHAGALCVGEVGPGLVYRVTPYDSPLCIPALGAPGCTRT